MSGRPGALRSDRGVVLVIVALMISVLFLIVAIVIDLGATRSDRRGGQLAVDNAAASAAQTLADADAETACLDAISISSVTLDVTGPFSGADCASLDPCSASVPNSTSATSGDYVITIHHPVLAASPLMQRSSTISNAGVASSAADGTPCERIAVEILTTGDPFFGGVANSGDRSSRVHAVSRVRENSFDVPLNLVALERYDCQSIDISGQGTVIVAATIDPDTNEFRPGVAAVDSEASENCAGNKATLEASGQGILQVDGPCAGDAFAQCAGTGRILLLAPFGPGTCAGSGDVPGCSEGTTASIDPIVEQTLARLTRAPIDHRYNCKSQAGYDSEPWADPAGELRQDIPGCDGSTDDTDYIDELKLFVETIDPATPPAGWTVIGPSNADCRPTGLTFTGNVFVNCSSFRPDGVVTFADGNVVFAGEVRVNTGDDLRIHSCSPSCTDTMNWDEDDNFDENQSSPDAAWTYFGGQLTVGAGSLSINKSAVVIGESGALSITGGTIVWVAPDGDGPLDDLALWSESEGGHQLNGGGGIDLVGVFFVGRATFSYVGGGVQVLDEAQFVANKLSFGGMGSIRMKPADDRAVEFPLEPTFSIIR